MLYRFFRFWLRFFYRILFRIKVKGIENVPAEGPLIICSNHLSLLDPPLVGIMMPRQLRYMAKAELFSIPLFGSLLRKIGAFPVQRGGVSRESIRLTLDILREGNALVIFPQGTRSSDLTTGQKGAASFALKTNAVVIPAAIIGSYKLFRPMRLIYGSPVDLDSYRQDPTSDHISMATEAIMKDIRHLVETHKP